MKKLIVALMALSFIYAACSTPTANNSTDGTNTSSNIEYVTFDQDQYWKAESTSQGIKVTFFALPEHYRNFYVEFANETIGISSFPQNWTDRSKDWTGIFPLVNAGKNYTFRFHVSEGTEILPTRKFNLHAIGGLQTTISPGNTAINATLSWSEEEETLLVKIPNGNARYIPTKNEVKFFAGTYNPNWNADFLCQWEFNSDQTEFLFEGTNYNTIKTNYYNSSKKNIFVQCLKKFKIDGCSNFEFLEYFSSNGISFGK